jgi:hypothetical protein
MGNEQTLARALAALQGPFELETSPEPLSEELLLAVLSQRIAEMLAQRPESLMSLLYRLDVLEEKIIPVMHPAAPEPTNVGLARLVIERQKQRAETKKNILPPPLENMQGWEW